MKLIWAIKLGTWKADRDITVQGFTEKCARLNVESFIISWPTEVLKVDGNIAPMIETAHKVDTSGKS